MMNNRDYMANIEFSLRWETPQSTHTEKYFGQNVNFWRDCFPPRLYEDLMQAGTDDRIEWKATPGEMVADYQEKKIFSIKPAQFAGKRQGSNELVPQTGRYYPKGFLKGVSSVFPENVQPFRFREVLSDRFVVDFNHPLAGKDLTISLVVQDMWKKDREKGGTCMDWVETIATGPGMQVRINGTPTDFQATDGYARQDESTDDHFYQKPRMVDHVDQTAGTVIQDLYSGILSPGMKVLDLMASWNSHVARDMGLGSLVGLGLNQQELEANPQLTGYHVLDLNRSPLLPFGQDTFDAVICSNSIEYLVDPIKVFQQVAGILKPNGVFAVTFSNRWFPPKVTRLWTALHEFERLGLVSEYFLQNDWFQKIHTFSMRGLPRPSDDKYIREFQYSDPVYAVWARKKS